MYISVGMPLRIAGFSLIWHMWVFAALGLMAFMLPDSMQMPMLGTGFGGLHIVFGIIIGRVGHGRQV